ncbi:MAG: glycosyltransferase, partial [Candidatus Thorarchaeota archaeon]|nr:glycosyltransferase [Candidatus Thorarchaeota archaeon]
MRILLVQESDWLKRGPHQQHHLIERLVAQGHNIRVIDYEIDWKETTNEGLLSRTKIYKASSKSINNQQVIVIRPPLLKAPILCYASITIFHSIAIIKQIKSFRPDVIVGMGILNAYLTARIAKLFRIPFVYYLIDSLHTLIPEKLLRPFGRLMEQKTLKLANQVLAINKHLGQYAKKMGSLREPEIITAGIDKLRFNPDIDGRPIRKRLEIPEDALVVFFMGWLYNFSGLQEVTKSIVEEKSDAYLLVLGRGDL